MQRSWGTTEEPPPSPLAGACAIEGCGKTVKARGWCGMHLRRWYKWGTTDLPERTKYRTCIQCKESLLRQSFTGSTSICIDCYPVYRQECNARRLSRSGGVQRLASELRQQQDGKCAICGIAEEDAPGHGGLHLDHDHATNVVRGLLCTNCNAGLGQFKDDPRRLLSAIDYLQRASMVTAS